MATGISTALSAQPQLDILEQWVMGFKARCRELPPEPRYPLKVVRHAYRLGFFRKPKSKQISVVY